MNELIKQLMLEAGYAAPELAERGQKLAELVIADVLDKIKYANTQHCAMTTYDLGIVSCVESKINNHIVKTYGYIKPGVF